jgi:hypothetical protein
MLRAFFYTKEQASPAFFCDYTLIEPIAVNLLDLEKHVGTGLHYEINKEIAE